MADKKEFLNGAKAIGSLKNAIKLYSDGSDEAAIEAFEKSRKSLAGRLEMMGDQEEFPNGNRAQGILRNAIQLHSNGKGEEASEAFEKCKMSLAEQLENVKIESQKPEHQQRQQEYVDSPEDLHGFLMEEIEKGKVSKIIDIAKGSIGYSYESLFGKYLNIHVTSVEVEDPYIREDHQIENFQNLCDLIVGKKIPVETIKLRTMKVNKQESKLNEIKDFLKQHNIDLILEHGSFHDRKIRLSTGWEIHLGKGLDYFEQSAKSVSDLDQRPCVETTISFHYRPKPNGT